VLAAVVVESFGIPTAFAVNALSFLLFTLALLAVKPRPRERPARATLRESLALVRANPRLAVLLLVVTAAGFSSDPMNTLAPAFAHAFGYRDVVGGYLIGVFGLGAVSAVFVVAGREMPRRRLIGALGLVIVGMALFASTPWLAAALPFLFLAGFGYLAANATSTARLQLEVHESQRGRIMGLWSIAFLGTRPLAALLDGAIASAAGVRVAGVVMTAPAIFAAGVLAWRERRAIEVPRLQA
jgi:predicted MFS family arabinose efflux permease